MYRTEKIDPSDKKKFYEQLNRELLALIEYEDEWLPALGNAAALLGHQLQHINWAGFYLMKNSLLILGPFQGKPACSAITLGSGVCGTAAQEMRTIVVPDVHLFPGHIACDEASQSEIVLPIIVKGVLYGVLDIDSPVKERFGPLDEAGLEQFVRTLEQHVKWDRMVL
jgi:GAF domain-containing protein